MRAVNLLLSLTVASLLFFSMHSQAIEKDSLSILPPSGLANAVVVRSSRLQFGVPEQFGVPGQRLFAQSSMSDAVRIAKQRFPGRVLSAKRTINRKGKVVFRIKILSKSGEIRTLRIPAAGPRTS